MEANKIKLLEFLGSGKKTFKIPVYQRNYDWKQEHCIKLFRDVEKIALSNFQTHHFLGALVYVVSHTQMNYTEYILIDGQQRITSVTLLLKALYDIIPDENTREDIYESYIINKRAPEPLRIRLKPIESDMSAYQSILDNDVSNNDSNIVTNYLLFKSLIEESQVEPEKLYKALDNIELVYIQLDKDKPSENPQLIFESLNSTGLSLTQADLIRNFLLMNHSDEEQTNLYKQYWVKIEELLTNSKISDFVRDYLTMKTCKISTKDKVYENFKEFAADPKNHVNEKALLIDLLAFAKYYSTFLYHHSDNQKINDYLNQFLILKSTTVYPVLLYIFDDCFKNKKLSENDLLEVLKVLISYIFRREICAYPTNALNKIFANLIAEVAQSDESSYSEKVLSILIKKFSSSTFPRNEEFANCFIQKDIYKSKVGKYLLCQLEEHFSKEKVSISGDITIEHIMPQTLSPQWQIDLGKKSKELHTQYLHTIGNLTISGYNSELSNKSFDDKKEIFKNSNISLSRNITKFDDWNEESILKRAKELSQTALQIWGLAEKYHTKAALSNIIDYDAVHSILTDMDATGHKPRQLILRGTEYSVNSWKKFMCTLCNELFELDNTLFYNLVKHKDFTGRARIIINNTNENMKDSHRISDHLYIETNLNAITLLNYCKMICNHYAISDDVFFMLTKK